MPCPKKTQLRRQIAASLAALPPQYIAGASAGIHSRLLPQLQNAHTIFCYVSVGKEPDTRRLIDELLQSGKRVCVPKTLGAGQMEARQITSLSQLQPAAYNLLEPPDDAPKVSPQELDIIVAPCVACDEQGGRLGHGGGYYDRFLQNSGCPVICLCYQALLQKRLPQEAFDKPVDIVLTESGSYPKNR